MTSRILPRAEYWKLQGTEVGPFADILPSEAVVTVVEGDDHVIIGAWAAFRVMHLEGVWIAPAHRGKGAVARKLWARMMDTLDKMAVTAAATSSQDAALSDLLVKHGATMLDGDHFSLKVGR